MTFDLVVVYSVLLYRLNIVFVTVMVSKGLSDGDIVKVEFCTVSNTDGQISINAWDSSRILVLKRGR